MTPLQPPVIQLVCDDSFGESKSWSGFGFNVWDVVQLLIAVSISRVVVVVLLWGAMINLSLIL